MSFVKNAAGRVLVAVGACLFVAGTSVGGVAILTGTRVLPVENPSTEIARILDARAAISSSVSSPLRGPLERTRSANSKGLAGPFARPDLQLAWTSRTNSGARASRRAPDG
jgi:hypothetical protein